MKVKQDEDENATISSWRKMQAVSCYKTVRYNDLSKSQAKLKVFEKHYSLLESAFRGNDNMF
jgi:hypothetical protein